MTETEKIKKQYGYENVSAADVLTQQQIIAANEFCEDYKKFLDDCKTEREAVNTVVAQARGRGFKPFEYGKSYSAGDKIYYNNRGKSLILAVVGEKPVDAGVNIIAAHIDSPRIDLKPNPLYEDGEMAFFKTHYYGGIKKYQWPTVPLALHGVVVKKDGAELEIRIGEKDNDPIFYITDLLPHLADDQVKKPMYQAVPGESLNVLVGSLPVSGEGGDRIKNAVLKYLGENYGICEEDFISSELTFVPQMKARDIGFDRSLIGSYGHDDRVCAYPCARVLLDMDYTPERTAVAVLADKEETGSAGNTGMNTNFLYDFICELAGGQGVNVRKTLAASRCLSADVNALFDPNFPEVYEKRNSAFINHGVCLTKYTGARGKSGTNDASAEFVGLVRKILNDAGVVWQTGELGKVDAGGGGTVAMFIAKLNIEVVDIGVGVISMHAPYEVVSKLDVHSAYNAFAAFVKNSK